MNTIYGLSNTDKMQHTFSKVLIEPSTEHGHPTATPKRECIVPTTRRASAHRYARHTQAPSRTRRLDPFLCKYADVPLRPILEPTRLGVNGRCRPVLHEVEPHQCDIDSCNCTCHRQFEGSEKAALVAYATKVAITFDATEDCLYTSPRMCRCTWTHGNLAFRILAID